jgi:hypothetical protein
MWKTNTITDKLNYACAKYYSLNEHLAVDEINVLIKVTGMFQEYTPKKHKWFGRKIPRDIHTI